MGPALSRDMWSGDSTMRTGDQRAVIILVEEERDQR
jgi:hypothetical protein